MTASTHHNRLSRQDLVAPRLSNAHDAARQNAPRDYKHPRIAAVLASCSHMDGTKNKFCQGSDNLDVIHVVRDQDDTFPAHEDGAFHAKHDTGLQVPYHPRQLCHEPDIRASLASAAFGPVAGHKKTRLRLKSAWRAPQYTRNSCTLRLLRLTPYRGEMAYHGGGRSIHPAEPPDELVVSGQGRIAGDTASDHPHIPVWLRALLLACLQTRQQERDSRERHRQLYPNTAHNTTTAATTIARLIARVSQTARAGSWGSILTYPSISHARPA